MTESHCMNDSSVPSTWPDSIRSCCANSDAYSCEGELDDSVRNIGEAVIYDSECLSPPLCWHYRKGKSPTSSSTTGTPHTPPLRVKAGRDGFDMDPITNLTLNGADVSGFKTTVWFRTVSDTADTSEVHISPATSAYSEINTFVLKLQYQSATQVNVSVEAVHVEYDPNQPKTCENIKVGSSDKYLESVNAWEQNRPVWHNLTFVRLGSTSSGSTTDEWLIYINSGSPHSVCSMKRFNLKDPETNPEHFFVNRLRFQSANEPSEDVQGFMFDNIVYQAYQVDQATGQVEVRDEYGTYFEERTN